MSALSSGITVLVHGPRLLSTARSFASRLIEETLTARGVTIVTSARVTTAERPQASDTGLGHIHGGPVTIICAGRTIKADETLAVTGCRPLLTGIELETIGLEPDNVLTGRLPDWLYTADDAGGKAQLTHIGKYRAQIVGERIAALAAGCEPEPVPENIPAPQVVFTDPQLVSNGPTEQRTRTFGHDIVTARIGYTSTAGAALLCDDAHGEAKFIIDRQTGVMLGVTSVGPGTSEPTRAATITITTDVPVYRLHRAVPAYSAASEIWLRLIESLPSELLHPER